MSTYHNLCSPAGGVGDVGGDGGDGGDDGYGGGDCDGDGGGDGVGDGGGRVVVVRARKTRKTRSLPTIVGAAGGVTSHHDGWVKQQVTVGK